MDAIKDKDRLYRLMIGQLQYDGYTNISKSLTQQYRPSSTIASSDELSRIFRASMSAGISKPKDIYSPYSQGALAPVSQLSRSIDFEFESDVQLLSSETATYQPTYMSQHKAPIRAADFTIDGMFVATGSADATIKILDVERMLAKSSSTQDPTSGLNPDEHPTIRTLYDHLDEVTTIAFHPQSAYLLSGSRDETIAIFDWGKSQAKKSARSIQEASPVNSISIHPSGDYFVVGCQQPTIRLYDIHTAIAYVSNCPSDQHTDSVNMVKYCENAHLFASCSEDGSIKVWDGVSNRCVQTIQDAHSGQGVCSVQFTKNSKYLLRFGVDKMFYFTTFSNQIDFVNSLLLTLSPTSGKDSIVKLWELASGRPIVKYTGAELSGQQQHKAQAEFNHTEDFVLFPCEKSISMCCWNARTAERQKLMPLGHQTSVRWIKHSPTMPAMITCSDDFKSRFWYYKGSGH